MSQEGSFYTFNGHREALYRLLEATVRGEAGCPDAEGDDCCPRNGEVEQPSAYPSPVLWYDDMRPSDIDAYHAANGRGRFGSDTTPGLEDPRVWSIPTQQTTAVNPIGERSRSKSHEVCKGGHTGEGEAACDREGRRSVAPIARQPVRKGALGERQASGPGSAGSSLSTMHQRKCAPVPTQPAMSSTKPHNSHSPNDEASDAAEEGREEDGAAAASTGSSSAYDRRCSKSVEKNECHPMVMTTPPATATPTTTPPDPSQATQTMFLPGLPSQVLVTQQQGDAGWEQPEGDESSQKEEEDADEAASEYASPSPTHPPRPSAKEDALPETRVASSAGENEPPHNGGKASRPEPDRGKRCDSVDDPLVAGSEDREEAASSRQNDGFTLALREFLGEPDPAQSGALANGSGGGGSSAGERLSPSFKYTPTPEVLPSGWSGGQSGVVAFLEKHLSHARARCPGGYAVRALQLACHVLRQPTVCVRVTGDRGGSAATGVRAATADDGHPEVVGIAGFVWEILRTNGGDGSSVAAS